jgi:hypothetical protein
VVIEFDFSEKNIQEPWLYISGFLEKYLRTMVRVNELFSKQNP